MGNRYYGQCRNCGTVKELKYMNRLIMLGPVKEWETLDVEDLGNEIVLSAHESYKPETVLLCVDCYADIRLAMESREDDDA